MSINLDHDPRTLADLRIKLAHLRADLRDAQFGFDLAKAKSEEDVIDERLQALIAEGKDFETDSKGNKKPVDPLGKNEEERKRNLLLGLADHPGFLQAQLRLNSLLGEIDLLTAAITSKEEEQRERERLTRQELVDALLGRHLDDVVTDAVLDLSRGPRHRTTDRAADDQAWGVPDSDPTIFSQPSDDEDHSDETALGETPAVDASTLEWGLAKRAEQARRTVEVPNPSTFDDEWAQVVGAQA